MIIGHQKQWQFLEEIKDKENFSHAYLFAGQEKLGKKSLALEWLQLLLGGKKEQPDLIFIQPEKKEIKIAQIKELIGKLALKPHSAPFKTAVIDQAHLMNQEAQTCLLKNIRRTKRHDNFNSD